MICRVSSSRPRPIAVDAGVVGDDGQVFDARLAQRLDQRFGDAAQAETARHDRHAVPENAGQGVLGAAVDLVHDPSRRGSELSIGGRRRRQERSGRLGNGTRRRGSGQLRQHGPHRLRPTGRRDGRRRPFALLELLQQRQRLGERRARAGLRRRLGNGDRLDALDPRFEVRIFGGAMGEPGALDAGLDEFLDMRRNELQMAEFPGERHLQAAAGQLVGDVEAIEIEFEDAQLLVVGRIAHADMGVEAAGAPRQRQIDRLEIIGGGDGDDVGIGRGRPTAPAATRRSGRP